MATEVELKLQLLESADTDVLKQLESILGVADFQRIDLRNIYFDTPDSHLHAERIALRIRYKQNRYIQTLKTRGSSVNGLHQRGEWEWDLESPVLNVGCLNNNTAWPATIDTSLLQPVFETNFTRHQQVIDWQNQKGESVSVELAVDMGQVMASGESEPISEIELELLSGESDTLLELGQYLLDRMPLKYADVSKAERGYRLYNSLMTD